MKFYKLLALTIIAILALNSCKALKPNVSIGKKCNPFDIEMVIRGYLSGHAWREYKLGKRELCGVELPNGLK